MPLVPVDSPLRKVPISLERQSVLFYDGKLSLEPTRVGKTPFAAQLQR